MSKAQINKLGRRIRKSLQAGTDIDATDLLLLQEYRTSFKNDVAPVFNIISKLSKDERSDSIAAFRVKRIETILSKIVREPTMSLGNMGDIAGCRIIVYSEDALRNLARVIHQHFNVKREKNYLDEPKEDGYTGYHIYVESPVSENKVIEIQIRTIKTHRWASLVEIIDMLFDLKLKEGQEHPEFENFFKLLAIGKDRLTIDQKKTIIEIDSKLNVYQSLNEVFVGNHIKIRNSWLKLSENLNRHFFIIEVDEQKKSSITSILEYKEAERKYFEMFLNNRTSNFVLTHIEKPNFRRICIAYASYMMIKHDYLFDWNDFAMEVLKYEVESGEVKSFEIYNDFVRRNLKDEQGLIEKELDEVEKHMEEFGENLPAGVKEWVDELVEQNKQVLMRIQEVKALEPPKRSLFQRIFG